MKNIDYLPRSNMVNVKLFAELPSAVSMVSQEKEMYPISLAFCELTSFTPKIA